jgi:predicted alpha/beta hydrolase family esterase
MPASLWAFPRTTAPLRCRLHQLPFLTIVVASENDRAVSFETGASFADAWRASLSVRPEPAISARNRIRTVAGRAHLLERLLIGAQPW